MADLLPPLILLENVTAGYPKKPVLQGVTLSVQKGDLVLITGKTGAGKTTLVKVLTGSLPVQHGRVQVLNTDFISSNRAQLTVFRKNIGQVFQIPRFLENQSVLTNVTLPLAIGGASPRKCRAEGVRALTSANLVNTILKKPSQLSGGELARLQIARALIHRPLLLIADEPFAHLDPDSTAEAEQLLVRAHLSGTTLIITSHRPTGLAERARIFLLEEGGLRPL